MIQFVFGALAGAAAAWYWRRDLEQYMNEKMPDLRSKAADRLQAIERSAEDALDRAKSGVVSRMRAGEERLRGAHEQGGEARTTPTGGQAHGTGAPGATGSGQSFGERARPQG